MPTVDLNDASHSPRRSATSNSPKSLPVNRQRSLTEGTRKLLLLGIELLAHREHKQEGMEVYVLEGRSNVSKGTKVFNVIRWLLWTVMLIINYADPIIAFCFSVLNYSLRPSITWLSVVAVLASILYAFEIRITISVCCLIINFVLRCVVLHQMGGFSEFSFPRVFTITSLCFVGVIILIELVDEARNSCK